MNLDFIQEEDKAPQQEDILTRLSKLADEAIQVKNELSAAQAEVDRLAQKEKTLLRSTIPSLMEEAGNMKDFTTKDGFSIEIKDEVQASITAERAPEAFAWLESHNFGGLIKTKLELEFGRGEDERKLRDEAKEKLIELGVEPVVKETVHPATLKSFVKEQLALPDNGLPLEVFGVFQYTVASLKMPKKGK